MSPRTNSAPGQSEISNFKSQILLLPLLLLTCSCGTHRVPFIAPSANRPPPGYSEFHRRQGYLDRAAYVASARNYGQALFRGYDAPRFALDHVYIANRRVKRVDQGSVLVTFFRTDPWTKGPLEVPSNPPTTSVSYALSAGAVVRSVTWRHTEPDDYLKDIAAAYSH